MKEVTQTILHDPDKGLIGNCFQAAIASVFELDINDVPHFSAWEGLAKTDGEWWQAVVDWFIGHYNLYPIYNQTDPENVDDTWYPSGFHLIDGYSPRQIAHVVVGKNGKMVWDPHPSREGLSKVTGYFVFAVLNPALIN